MTIQANQGFGVSIFGATGSGGGGSTSPGGSSGQLQYNASGSFGGMAGTSWDDTNRALTITGATVTTSKPILDLSQTWNAGAVTFTGLKFNATDTASAAASLLLDLQVGGASKLAVNKAGSIQNNNNHYIGYGSFTQPGLGNISFSNNNYISTSNFTVTSSLGVGGSANTVGNSQITSPTTATLQLGAADAAAPVAQTLQVQNVVAGTTNTAGANWTLKGSAGTGTGAGGSIIFQVAPAGGSGTAQNAFANSLILSSSPGTATLVSSNGGSGALVIASSANNNVTTQYKFSTGTDGSGGSTEGYIGRISGNYGIFDGSAGIIVAKISGQNLLGIFGNDCLLARDAANTLALRNGANAQTFNIYNTYTDASNYTRCAFTWFGGEARLITQNAGTGAAADLGFYANSQVVFGTSGAGGIFKVTGTGLLAQTDNSYDIGASGANRPRYVYAGTRVDAPTLRTATAYTVATLPAAGTAGRRAYVTDATAPTWGGALTGGGAVVTPVFDNGTAWVAG